MLLSLVVLRHVPTGKHLTDEQIYLFICLDRIFLVEIFYMMCRSVLHHSTCHSGKTWYCRGVRHSCPTTRNEAVGMSGKQDLASLVYLQHEHGHCDQTMFGWGPSWFFVSSCCFKLERNILCHDFGA